MRKFLFILCFLLNINIVFSQCPIKAHAYPSVINCGDSISLSALHSISQPLNANFNKGKVDSLLLTTANSRVVESSDTTYYCFGPSPEGSHYLVMSTSIDTPRYVRTIQLNLSVEGATGGTICFMMRYGLQKGLGQKGDPCEGLEGYTEGVYLEYFTQQNQRWKTMYYWNPKISPNPFDLELDTTLTVWNRYCFPIPLDALTNKTNFQLIQKFNDGIGYDAWAVDDITIILDIDGYKYDWYHDNLPADTIYNTPLVTPTADTTYTVFYSNGRVSCVDSVKITVLPPIDKLNASSECLSSHLYIPNAFTPNDDGLNDVFQPITFNVIEYELEIYNRYGICIFRTKKYQEGWNGKIIDSDEIQQQDVYSYTIKIKNFDRKLHYYIGKIVLIK